MNVACQWVPVQTVVSDDDLVLCHGKSLKPWIGSSSSMLVKHAPKDGDFVIACSGRLMGVVDFSKRLFTDGL